MCQPAANADSCTVFLFPQDCRHRLRVGRRGTTRPALAIALQLIVSATLTTVVRRIGVHAQSTLHLRVQLPTEGNDFLVQVVGCKMCAAISSQLGFEWLPRVEYLGKRARGFPVPSCPSHDSPAVGNYITALRFFTGQMNSAAPQGRVGFFCDAGNLKGKRKILEIRGWCIGGIN